MSPQDVYKRGDIAQRPWGEWEVLDVGERYVAKRIRISPGGFLSLQYHDYRDEHWVIVRGVATVRLGDKTVQGRENQHFHVPAGTVHRVGNGGDTVLEIIEVQTGAVLREDDIVRLEDVYKRT